MDSITPDHQGDSITMFPNELPGKAEALIDSNGDLSLDIKQAWNQLRSTATTSS
ncbi:unnamed protein product [Dovyalis caffra]|uniref:Uncharacterized protein n=1 Tax=Dovyalis caffra TaxID=77055 RepID=A0AAV1SC13_9ROSI|nr:unnamed protein product [Dovyalis caffra]